MRQIKFRAWDKEEEMMLSDVDLNNIVDTWDTINEIFTNTTDELHFMQYTGLKDKNGTEVCEGDIVFFSGDDKELTQKMTAEWTEAEFVLLIDTKDWAYSLSGTPSSCLEVIGNIYEDKHLLEVE